MNDHERPPDRPGAEEHPGELPFACPVCGTTHWPEEPVLCRACGEPALRGGWAP